MLNLDTIKYSLLYKDVRNNISQTVTKSIQISNPHLDNIFYLDINKVKVPFDNKGIIGDVDIYDSLGNRMAGARFEESHFLYSGGFALSGYSN